MGSRAQRLLPLIPIANAFGFKAVNSFNGKSMKEFDAEGAANAARPPRNPREHTRRCNERATETDPDCTCGANMGECSICRREHGPEVQHACE